MLLEPPSAVRYALVPTLCRGHSGRMAPAAPNCFRNDRLVLSLQTIPVSFSPLPGQAHGES